MNEDYDSETFNNDIALLELRNPIVFNDDNKIAPICLPTSDKSYKKMKAIVTGWGLLSEGQSLSTLASDQFACQPLINHYSLFLDQLQFSYSLASYKLASLLISHGIPSHHVIHGATSPKISHESK